MDGLGLLIAGAAGGIILGLWLGIRWATWEQCAPFQQRHAWGPWSEPYPVLGQHGRWQERSCPCGNRDFRRAR